MSKGTTKCVELPKQFSAEITELNDGRVLRYRLLRRSSGDWVISLFGLVRPGLGFTGCISGWTLYRIITRITTGAYLIIQDREFGPRLTCWSIRGRASLHCIVAATR